MTDRYAAKVVKVFDDYSIVVNRGTGHRLNVGDEFLVIGLGEVIRDPDTNEDLEQLEIVKGKVEIVHAQEKIATLKRVSDRRGFASGRPGGGTCAQSVERAG